jgi:hypothetical protein
VLAPQGVEVRVLSTAPKFHRRRNFALLTHADSFQKRELRQMTFRSVSNWVLTIFVVTLISIAVTSLTDVFVVEHTSSIKTPGMFVMELVDSGPMILKLGHKMLLVFSIDFLVYFTAVWCLIALFKWRFRENR